MTDTALKNTKLIVRSLAIVACNSRLQLRHEYCFLTPCLTIFLLSLLRAIYISNEKFETDGQ